MSKFSIPRRSRTIAGLVVVSAFAAAPVAAQAADTTASGTLTAGSLTNTAPTIGSLSTTLTGLNQTVFTTVGAWNVNDATGSDAGYSITVAASNPTDTGASAGTGGSITLTPTTATAATGNPAATGPVATTSPVLLSTTAATIDDAVATTGQGKWNFAADTGGAHNLAVVIPGNASAGTYSSTLSYTTAPPV